MKRQIRRSVFETNSSSTHSLTMCTEKQFDDWKNGKLMYNRWKREFVEPKILTERDKKDAKEEYDYKKSVFWKDWDALTDDEKNEWYTKYAIDHNIKDSYCETYDEWQNDYNLETFVNGYTTPGGEKVIAFGKYGYDG